MRKKDQQIANLETECELRFRISHLWLFLSVTWVEDVFKWTLVVGE